MTCLRPGCTSVIIRVDEDREFRVVVRRAVCLAGHSTWTYNLLADTLNGRAPEPITRRRRSRLAPKLCAVCGDEIPRVRHSAKTCSLECAKERKADLDHRHKRSHVARARVA